MNIEQKNNNNSNKTQGKKRIYVKKSQCPTIKRKFLRSDRIKIQKEFNTVSTSERTEKVREEILK